MTILKRLVSIFFLSVSLVILLYHFAKINMHQKNGFTRKIAPNAVSLINAYDLKFNSYYIAGLTDNHIYLGNYVTPSIILETDYNFTNIKTYNIIKKDSSRIRWSKVSIQVDSPHLHVLEGTTPAVGHATLDKLEIINYALDTMHFSAALNIAPDRYIAKVFDNKSNQFQLTKVYSHKFHLENNRGILQKQEDGIFSVDGMLSYEKNSNKLSYVYFYRNQLVVFDTALNIIFQTKTIDTNTQANIKVALIKSENKMTLSAPPVIVNKESSLTEQFIFIRSALMADNEQPHIFEQSAVIDAYLLSTGAYKFSFYLPDFDHGKISNFKVINNKLIAISNHSVCSYKINF